MELILIDYEGELAKLTEARGYTPRFGMQWNKRWGVSNIAYALISPSSISEKSGETRGRLTNEIEFILLTNNPIRSDQDEYFAREELRNDAIEITNDLLQISGVLAISELTIEATEMPISDYSGVATKVSVEVVSTYQIRACKESSAE